MHTSAAIVKWDKPITTPPSRSKGFLPDTLNMRCKGNERCSRTNSINVDDRRNHSNELNYPYTTRHQKGYRVPG